ncbi:Pre-mRNA-splicing factor clf1 [Smittium culicis]|uniref:Pre-mRNA-splicing factor clf1 n=1 Tax=Smittium culicis TaxID=133412 RepID=A0A1R1YNK5_9FUNG|nr:Pre-mRNA-splicing factor clf1 [Smittium culicis]
MDDKMVPGGYDRTAKPPKIKNKNPAPVQITAEQLLREVQERKEPIYKPPEQKLVDGEELYAYQMRKRKEYEDSIRRNRLNIGTWLRYSAWEESQNNLDRARSIFERALDVDSSNQTIYLKYVEMEMKHRNVNLARNLFDRVVTLLPRVNQFWFRYTYMEEVLGNIIGARQVFERWMKWEPEESAWNAYVKFEKRYNEIDKAEAVYERFVYVHPDPKNWLKWAGLVESHGKIDKVREVFGMALDRLGSAHMNQHIFIAYAKFEAKVKEVERARVIYKYGLENLPQSKSQALYNQYVLFEKQHGDQDDIEYIVSSKRRQQYQKKLKESPFDYNTWLDLTQLEESVGNIDLAREAYKDAVNAVPQVEEKRVWRRYIYLWLLYAAFEEISSKDIESARSVYKDCLSKIPHKKFTFAKVWIQFAQFEIRQMNLKEARLLLGRGIGMCPKNRLFRGYIELELQLREFDRVRILYNKQLEFNPSICTTWIEFAKMESLLGETERSRSIYELAIEQDELDMPELLWKAYIDFEVSEGEFDKAREIYERLIHRSGHIKVWISYARFECFLSNEESESFETGSKDDKANVDKDRAKKSRSIFERAYKHYKSLQQSESRVLVLEAWKKFETEFGDDESNSHVDSLMPNKVKRRRQTSDGGWEEYLDYVFPDDKDQMPNIKLLEMARQWKQKMSEMDASKDTSES